jgi:hypothetical protein
MRILALCSAAALFAALHAAQAPSLDGRTIAVAFTDGQGKAQDKDELVFAKGTLALPALDKRYHFAAAPCTVTTEPKGTAFTATLTSQEHGRIVIAGTIAGGTATGTRTWLKNDKDPIVHAFTGSVARP